jgi:hypothetical protein
MGQEQRRFERMKLRLSCELHYEGRHSTGMVLDISARGLFVRTTTGARPPAGADFRVLITGADSGDMELRARLARSRVVRRELVSAASGGFGLELVSAPEAYYNLLKPLTEL